MHDKHTTHYLITVKKLSYSSYKIVLKMKADTVETEYYDIGYNQARSQDLEKGGRAILKE